MKTPSLVVGFLITFVVHGLMVWAAVTHDPKRAHMYVPSQMGESGRFRHGLCDRQRCPLPEMSHRKRPAEDDPLGDMEVLEAALLPALGRAKKKPTNKLPTLQTYEQPERVEDGVNLDEDNPLKDKDLFKDEQPEEEKRDPDSDELNELLKDFKEDDERKNPTELNKIIGHEEGEVGGQGDVIKAGNLYATKVARKLRKVFVIPPFIGLQELKSLRVHVKVKKISPAGTITTYTVVKQSGNRAFDDAALAAVRVFVPDEGGSQALPPPEPGVLRYVNTKGMRITLDGRFLSL